MFYQIEFHPAFETFLHLLIVVAARELDETAAPVALAIVEVLPRRVSMPGAHQLFVFAGVEAIAEMLVDDGLPLFIELNGRIVAAEGSFGSLVLNSCVACPIKRFGVLARSLGSW